jgi:hypothetical protein
MQRPAHPLMRRATRLTLDERALFNLSRQAFCEFQNYITRVRVCVFI